MCGKIIEAFKAAGLCGGEAGAASAAAVEEGKLLDAPVVIAEQALDLENPLANEVSSNCSNCAVRTQWGS